MGEGDQEQVGEGGPRAGGWVRGDQEQVGEGDQEQVGEGGPRAGG